MSEIIYERLSLIGMGLVASSIALAAKKSGVVGEIVGHSKTQKTADVALELGLADEMFASPEDAVRGADLAILCTPVCTFGEIAKRISPHIKKGATLSDVGSVKRYVLDAVEPHVSNGVEFIPAHPIAGTEHSGPRSGFAELFENRWCILTPRRGFDTGAVERLSAFWSKLGANVEVMDPDHHDVVLAVTSHVPHLIAYTMVGVADDLESVTNSEVIQYSAAGFRDFTRIAASDPTMWRDVFLTNREATLDILSHFVEELISLQRAVRTGRGDKLHSYFRRTRSVRRRIIEAGQDTPAVDFGRGAAQHAKSDD